MNNKKLVTHARGIELAKSLILTFPIKQNDRLKLTAGSCGPGGKRGALPLPPPSERVRDAGRETAIKLQPRPHGSSWLERLNEIHLFQTCNW